MDDFPDPILEQILRELFGRDLVSASLVCRRWYAMAMASSCLIDERILAGRGDLIRLGMREEWDNPDDILQHATAHGHLPVARLALKRGADLSNTPIRAALKNGHIDLFIALNEYNTRRLGYAIGKIDYLAQLRTAAKHGQRRGLEWLLDHSDCVNMADRERDPAQPETMREYYNSCLTDAAFGGQREIVEWMLMMGADEIDRAFIYACKGGRRRIAERLSEISAPNSWIREMAIAFACQGGHRDFLEWIASLGPTNYNHLFSTIIQYSWDRKRRVWSPESLEAVEWLINEGKLDYSNLDIQAVLTSAVWIGNQALARCLVDLARRIGVSVSVTDRPMIYSWNPSYTLSFIERAIENGGIDIDMILSNACHTNRLDIVELAIKEGATDFQSGLIKACAAGNEAAAERMLEMGATNIADALLLVCERGGRRMAKLLVDAGAPITDEMILCARSNRWRGLSDYLRERQRAQER